MATIIVQSDGGGDYTTLAAAVSNASDGDTIEIQETWASAEAANITISLANLTIQCTGDAKHPGHAQGTRTHYRIEDNSGDHIFTVNASGLTLDGLDICQSGTGVSDECIRVASDGGTLTVKNCLIWADGAVSDQDGVYAGNIDCTVNVENCIIWGFGRAGIHPQPYTTLQTQTWNVISCTIWDCETYPSETEGGCISSRPNHSGTVININVFNTICLPGPATKGASGDFNEWLGNGITNWTIIRAVYNSTAESDASIDTPVDSLSGRLATDSDTPDAGDWVVFQDITSAIPDLRLKDNDENDAQDMHADSSGPNSMSMPAYDIVGTERPQNGAYDIGAFEIPGDGAAIDVGDAVHAQMATALALTQHSTLETANAVHAVSSQDVDLVFIPAEALIVANSAHGHQAGSAILTEHGALQAQNADHGHQVEPTVLTEHGVLPAENTLHTVASTTVELTQHGNLPAENSIHAAASTSVGIIQQGSIGVGSSIHSVVSGTPGLIQHGSLQPENGVHSQAASSPATIEHSVLSPADTVHGQAATGTDLTQHGTIQAQDSKHFQPTTAIDVTFIPAGTSAAANSVHSMGSSIPVLTQHNILTVNDSGHAVAGSTAVNIIFNLPPVLDGLDATHGQQAQEIALTQHNTLTVDDSGHQAISEEPLPVYIPPPTRTVTAGASSVSNTVNKIAILQHHVLFANNSSHLHSGMFVDFNLPRCVAKIRWSSSKSSVGWKSKNPSTGFSGCSNIE
jgi:hypothetical protein